MTGSQLGFHESRCIARIHDCECDCGNWLILDVRRTQNISIWLCCKWRAKTRAPCSCPLKRRPPSQLRAAECGRRSSFADSLHNCACRQPSSAPKFADNGCPVQVTSLSARSRKPYLVAFRRVGVHIAANTASCLCESRDREKVCDGDGCCTVTACRQFGWAVKHSGGSKLRQSMAATAVRLIWVGTTACRPWA